MKSIDPLRGVVVLLTISTMALSAFVQKSLAHEYWIEPHAYRVQAGENILADLKVGQNFGGDRMPFIPARFHAFEINSSTGSAPVAGELGAMPALNQAPAAGGLQIVTYHSKSDRLTFNKWEKFLSYLVYEGLEHIAEAHQMRKLPESGFTERYARCAKALVQVGAHVGGGDRYTGMPLELVALGNPYEGDLGSTLAVRLLWRGKGLAGAQIRVFAKGAETGEVTLRTDADGRAEIPVTGLSAYLLNAVHMVPADAQSGAAWQSYWASLTFEITE